MIYKTLGPKHPFQLKKEFFKGVHARHVGSLGQNLSRMERGPFEMSVSLQKVKLVGFVSVFSFIAQANPGCHS